MNTISKVRGLGQIKTLQNCKQRSIPVHKRSLDLEAYILRKERNLFENEETRLLKRLETVQARIASIDNALKEAETIMVQKISAKEQTLENKKQWKTKPLNY